jgi:quinol monooxygenase YgiN
MKAILLVVLLAGGYGAMATPASADHAATAHAAAPRQAITALLSRADGQDIGNGQREGMHLAADDHNAASNVFWTFGVTIKNGKLDALQDLIKEMADASRANEPGTLIYEWTISADRKTAEVHERYADSDAALRHLASFNKNFADRLMALVEPTGMTIYGSPGAALKKELEGAKPVYREVFGGFAR